MTDSKILERISAEIKKLKTHPAGNDDYHSGYQDGRNDALTILEEAIDNLRAGNIEANARLIAAVPELLECLKALVAETVEFATINKLGDPEKQHNIKWARSVIAKATA